MKRKYSNGFSLVEMAVVLVIIGLLLGGLLMPLATQMEQQKILETRKTIEAAKEALLGFAAANGRLPCPADENSNGVEIFLSAADNASTGRCAAYPNGSFLPAVTLGLNGLDSEGYATDAWGIRQNRLRYMVFTGNIGPSNNTFTRADGMRSAGMATIAGTPELLSICRTNSTATNCGGAANVLTLQAPMLVFSLGRNATSGAPGVDEAQNLNNDTIFVSHEMAAPTAPNGEFDDILSWVSINTLFSRMMTAGTLP